jgi:2-O-methyltransferase
MDAAEEKAVREILQAVPEHPVIVELGAYRGEDGERFEEMIRKNEQLLHIMVEPDPVNVAFITLNKRRPLGPYRRLMRGAVGATTGTRQFRFSRDTRDGSRGSGSLCEPTGHLEHFPTILFDGGTTVDCWTLDQIFADHQLKKIDLLWVDIQGAEKEMIAGGQNALAHTHFCFMEAEEIQMYAGQALKAELIELMAGWRLVKDFGFNILLENTQYA